MKKVLLGLFVIALAGLGWGQNSNCPSSSSPFVQSITYINSAAAAVQATVPEQGGYSTHTMCVTVTSGSGGTSSGTVQLYSGSTAAGVTGISGTTLSFSTTASTTSYYTFTLTGTTANYFALYPAVSVCYTCTVTITYIPSNPPTGVLQDGSYWVPLQSCGWSSTTALGTPHTGTTENGSYNLNAALTVTGENVLYVNIASSASDVVTLDCDISPPSRTTSGKGKVITSVDLFYGLIYATVTITASTPTLNTQTFQATSSGATAAAPTLASAGGTLTLAPSGMPKVTTTTNGQCYHMNIAPATPITLNSNVAKLNLEQVFTASGSAAVQEYQLCGVQVNYQDEPL